MIFKGRKCMPKTKSSPGLAAAVGAPTMTRSKLGLAAIAAAGALTLGTSGAFATTIDPLHGICNGSGSGTCVDNGTNTPLGNSTQFGFFLSPGSSTGTTGTDILVFLQPSNETQGSITVTGINGYPGGTATLFSSTPWTSGDLASYLGLAASPNNPIGAYLPTTQSLDPGATGFDVYTVNLGTDTLFNQANQKYMWNVPGGLDLGGYAVKFFNTGTSANPDCPSGPGGEMCATANSGALLVDAPPTTTTTTRVPEPGALALLGSALLGFGLLGRRRRRI